ncbi:uncharacterized protein isoform X2 [Choristoneura fumiferana]|uniref:uncharacterized protein isoform X2 n=1 Tax=Choristoneura fumiferana TaxID=7141 RepID=UPI003D1542BB
MPVSAFAEVTKQVHVLNDLILDDMIYAREQNEIETLQFNKHLSALKNWFTRISTPNKKRFLLALIEDISSAWALSLILMSIWNCRTKDAIMSVCERRIWSSYDQNPMDHNRTALPIQTLIQVMKYDRKWFLSLEPETQGAVICELLSVVGSPVLLQVLNRAQHIHERYRKNQIKSIEMSLVVDDSPTKRDPPPVATAAPQKPDKSRPSHSKAAGAEASFLAQSKLNEHLAKWDATIKAMKENMNLKEFQVLFKDGTQRTIWKIKRSNPEDTETVDFIQLLPSSIGKIILSYLPVNSLSDYARVNKYWAYLVEELRSERAARVKINADLEKLQDLMFINDTSMENFETFEFKVMAPSIQATSLGPSVKIRAQQLPSTKTSMKSAGAYSFRRFVTDSMYVPEPIFQIPIRNLNQMKDRLDNRGALDENVWTWCETILNRRRSRKDSSTSNEKETDGILLLSNLHFPCPLMTHTLKLPLNPPLVKDHTARYTSIKMK